MLPNNQTSGRRPSLSDVAAAAGVGKSTAARALADGRKVARKTQKVVQEAARKLGYQPDILFSSRARDHWRSTGKFSGIPIVYLHHHAYAVDLNAKFGPGLAETARASGFHLDLIDAEAYPDPRRLNQVLLARGIQGVILGTCRCPLERMHLDWSPFSVVACENSHFKPPCDWVLQDYAWSMRQACIQVARRGYRRPALAILREVRTDDHWQMESAFRITCEELLGAASLPVYYGGFGDEVGFFNWMDQARPDVVISNNPTPAWWIQPARTPAFACITCGPDSHVSGFGPVLPLLLERALQQLESLLRRNQRGLPASPTVLHVQPPWQEGETLPDRSGS